MTVQPQFSIASIAAGPLSTGLSASHRPPRPATRPVPKNLFGTRAALFYLWGCARAAAARETGGGSAAPADLSQRTRPLPALAAPRQSGVLPSLFDDVFIFH